MVLYQLSRPLAYLTIHDSSKWKIDWLLPFVFSTSTTVVYLLLSVKPVVFGMAGILWQLAGLLQILPGFYIASLAAIATFNKGNMDEYMPEPTPTVNVRVSGHSLPIRLTRRRMLSLLFGYLAFMSLILFLLIITANLLAPSLNRCLPQSLHALAVATFIAIYGLLFWNLISVTLFGLYQLSDRMHQPDQATHSD
jgi:hypothetical protein